MRVRPINNQWRRKVRGLSSLHRRSLQRLSITKINLPRNLHSGKSDPTHPSLLGIVGKFNDFVPLVPRAAAPRRHTGAREFSACFRRTPLHVQFISAHCYISFQTVYSSKSNCRIYIFFILIIKVLNIFNFLSKPLKLAFLYAKKIFL